MFTCWPNALLEFSLSGSWELTRPWAAALLLLPLLLLLLSLRRIEQRIVLLGTARFFSGLAGGGGRSSSRRLTASRLLASLALVVAAGAAMGPAPREASDPESSWLVVVDRSPSMYLEASAGSTRSRLESSLDAARALLEEAAVPSSSVRYVDGSTGGGALGDARALEAAPPAQLLERPAQPLPEPSWWAFDHAGVLWVTDRAPSEPPSAAGWVASGGDAVPGPVGWGPEGALVWEGPGTDPQVDPGQRPRAWIGGELDPVIAAFAGAWASDRGIALVEDPEDAKELVVEGMGPLSTRAFDRNGGRDGWWVSYAATAGVPPESGRPWWVAAGDGPRLELITFGPGRVTVAPLRLEGAPLPADAFAVSMASLLDAALVAPGWVVPLAERASAGATDRSAPEPPLMATAEMDRARGERERGERLATAVLALIAVVLAGAAAVARTREFAPRRA